MQLTVSLVNCFKGIYICQVLSFLLSFQDDSRQTLLKLLLKYYFMFMHYVRMSMLSGVHACVCAHAMLCMWIQFSTLPMWVSGIGTSLPASVHWAILPELPPPLPLPPSPLPALTLWGCFSSWALLPIIRLAGLMCFSDRAGSVNTLVGIFFLSFSSMYWKCGTVKPLSHFIHPQFHPVTILLCLFFFSPLSSVERVPGT